jgi:hypothetical protein
MQLLTSLLAGLKAICATFPDLRKGRRGNIEIADFGLSAFAMFFMQSASFLTFQLSLEKGLGRSNCQTLFGIDRIPSDNYIRDALDEADPVLLQPCFESMETLLAEPPMQKAFGRLGGRTLIAWDGTEYFRSQKLGCPHCLTRKRSNGKTENYHCMLSATVVAPSQSKVVPLMPEFIAPQDGAEKQDCERNAAKRWFETHHARLAPLRPIYLGDDLFACHPVAKMITDAGGDFIFTRKPRTRRSTTSSPAPNFPVTRKKCAGATPRIRTATVGSRPFRSTTARTPCSSIGSVSKSWTPRERSNIPWPG